MHVHVLRAAPSHSQFKIVRAPAAGYRPNAVRADLSADLLDYQLMLRPRAKRAKGASPGSLNRAAKRKSRFPAISSPSSEVRNVPRPDHNQPVGGRPRAGLFYGRFSRKITSLRGSSTPSRGGRPARRLAKIATQLNI